MTDAVDARREFVEDLRDRELVDDVDFSRDGFRTVVLQLGDTQGDGDEETVEVPAWAAHEAWEEFERLIEQTADEDPDPLTDRTFRARDEFWNALEALAEPDSDNADGGSPELSVTFGDHRETFFQSESGQWYRQEWERTPERVSEDWRPVGIEAIDEPSVEVYDAA